MRIAARLAVLALCLFPTTGQGQQPSAESDLDAFMTRVLTRRDDNWKKLQQYILDERELIDVRGPARAPIWGQDRLFTWYVRDGYFVRSPVRFNGVTVGDGDRRKYEEDFLRNVKRRDQRQAERLAAAGTPLEPEPRDVQGIIRQLREPSFISSAYFLQFKFEKGRYALAGRETLDGRQVLRIEYYPTRLFTEDGGNSRTDRRQAELADKKNDDAYERAFAGLMNKASLVTIWVEPNLHQILKYTFDNVGLEFLPMGWLFRAEDLHASMMMSEAFPGVWLPTRVDMTGSATLALGRLTAIYRVDYNNYRQAEVTSTIRGATIR